MGDPLASIVNLLSCPDDGASLQITSKGFQCSSCERSFPMLAGNMAEILPLRPLTLPISTSSSYKDGYLQAFDETFDGDHTGVAWGAEESVSETWVRKRRRQVAAVQPLITEGTVSGESILCDVAAGAGYYTFAYAPLFRTVIHCDLSVNNLSYAWRKAHALGIQNVFFLRVDYFSLPFQHTLDRILCLDTIIRGEMHDSTLLATVARALKPEGHAVVDLHNWWHNPIRRLGLLPENFHDNRSYRRCEAERLLSSVGITDFSSHTFLQEFEPNTRSTKLLSRVFPATRLIYRFGPTHAEPFTAVPNRSVSASH